MYMNITYLVGNGFDLNLGLETRYADFITVYKNQVLSDKNLENFRWSVASNLALWSNAELAFGKCTLDKCIDLARKKSLLGKRSHRGSSLKNKPSTRVIIHAFDAPNAQLIRTKYLQYERTTKEMFLNYSNISDNLKTSIMERIHISPANIFSPMNNLVNHEKNKSNVLVVTG